MKKILALILVIVMIASCFAGCKGKSVTIGYTENKPWIYEDEKTGELVGFDVELAKAVFKEMGYSVTFKKIEADKDIFAELNSGEIDCIWNGLTAADATGQTNMEFSYDYAVKDDIRYTVGFVLGNKLVDGVNNTLKKLAEDGFTTDLAKKYKKDNIEAIVDFSAASASGIVVGYVNNNVPLSYKDAENNLVGFDVELAKAVYEGLGYTVTFKEISMDQKYSNLDSGMVDCIWSGFPYGGVDSDGVAHTERAAFSFKYLQKRQVIVVRKDSGIKAVADLADKVGCAYAGSAGEEYLLTLGCATPYGLDTEQECLDAVNYGVYDCNFAVVDELVAKAYCTEEMNPDVMILEGPAYEYGYYAVPFLKWKNKEDNKDALVNKVNEQLEKLAADGTIAKLAEKYGLSDAVITDFADQKK